MYLVVLNTTPATEIYTLSLHDALPICLQGGSMSPKTDTRKSAKSATVTGRAVKGFTDEERAAMKERVQELKAEARQIGRASCRERVEVWVVGGVVRERGEEAQGDKNEQ